MTDLTGRKPILCLDFDGTCSDYSSGWKGSAVIPDPPVPGLFKFLYEVAAHFEINIFSSRSHQPGGIDAMREWFFDELCVSCPWYVGFIPKDKAREWIAENLIFPTEKPPAMITLDDRGILFTGDWPSLETLKNFKPWYKQGKQGAV